MEKNVLKHVLGIAACFIAILLMTGCDPDEPDPITASPSIIRVQNTIGSTSNFMITVAGDWQITSTPSWLEVYPLSGKGNTSVTVRVTELNPESTQRKEEIRMTDGKNYAAVSVEQTGINLLATPAQLEMRSDKDSQVTFRIETAGSWNIENIPSWLSVSASAGQGDATITASALSQNSSASVRTANLTIRSSSLSATVSINQLAAYQANCTVKFSDVLVLSNSVAFYYNPDSNVDYFYSGYLSGGAAGWTDDRIAETLTSEDRFDAQGSDLTGIYGFGNLTPDTDYYLCAVAFNSRGERGEITKQLIHTPKSTNTSAYVTIGNVTYSSTQWKWTTSKNAYTQKYYMFATDGTFAWLISLLYNDAQVAMMIKEFAEEDILAPIPNDGNWEMIREADAEDIFISTWALDANNSFAPTIVRFDGSISRSSSTKTKAVQPTKANTPLVVSDIKEHILFPSRIEK